MNVQTQRLTLAGPAGDIECALDAPAGPARAVLVICHPHPLYGGAMSNKVVYTLASTAGKAGLATLRFNFRGVGKSAGVHDDGQGETSRRHWYWRVFPSVPLSRSRPPRRPGPWAS